MKIKKMFLGCFIPTMMWQTFKEKVRFFSSVQILALVEKKFKTDAHLIAGFAVLYYILCNFR